MYEKVMEDAFVDFKAALQRMLAHTAPDTPAPRPRVFRLWQGTTWPGIDENGQTEYDVIHGDGGAYHIDDVYNSPERFAKLCVHDCGGQPRLILRALRRIQAATAWCEARTEGRRRQAEEIMRQQASSAQALEAEAAMRVFRR